MKTDNELIDEFAPEVAAKINWSKPKHIAQQEGLRFHSSWDWLMPVVEKISKMGLGPIDNDRATSLEIEEATKQAEVCLLCIDTPIQTVYESVVEFIKWYNTQKS